MNLRPYQLDAIQRARLALTQAPRRSVLVLFNVAQHEGGMRPCDIAWLLGMSPQNVGDAERKGLAKLRRKVAA